MFGRHVPARDGFLDRALCTRVRSVEGTLWQLPCAHESKPEVVVAVARRVVVAIRRPRVLGGVVPATAPYYPVRA